MPFKTYKSRFSIPPPGVVGDVPEWASNSVYVAAGSAVDAFAAASASLSASFAAGMAEDYSGSETWYDRRSIDKDWYAASASIEGIIMEDGDGKDIVYSTKFNTTKEYVEAGKLTGPAVQSGAVFRNKKWSITNPPETFVVNAESS